MIIREHLTGITPDLKPDTWPAKPLDGLGTFAKRSCVVCHRAVIAWQMFGERADGNAYGFSFVACIGERQSQDSRNGIIQRVGRQGSFGA